MILDYIKCGDNAELLKELPDESVDLTVTSPPYDDLRTYNGFAWDIEKIVKELYRVTKTGGVVVWVVCDGVVNGSETCSSFKQAICFKDNGFNLHDTMIWEKDSFNFPEKNRYRQCFEYMFVFSKGMPKSYNLIADRKNKWAGTKIHGTSRCKNGDMFKKTNVGDMVDEFGVRFNVWQIPGEKANKTGHPAVFPERLARDHILSWSNKGDTVLDIFCGSGTTCLSALETGRHYIGFDISEEYCEMSRKRIETEKNRPKQLSFFEEV